MSPTRNGLGIGLMILTMLIFSLQDGISRYLADIYGVVLIVMIRYWFFASFVLTYSVRRPGSLAEVSGSKRLWLQIFRGILLVAEIVVMITAFTRLGLAESHAIFAVYPLIVAALSGPVLGERVGWRRWAAIGVGFLGLLMILQPGGRVFSVDALIPLLAAVMFAFYSLLTRMVASYDRPETSFFWTGIAGVIAITIYGFPEWQPLSSSDWVWMTALGILGALGHFTLIKALSVAEASVVQPFAYFHFVFATLVGVMVFHEVVDAWTIAGAAVIISAGIFTLWREARATRS